jgi:type II restriction enzyme
MNLKLNINRAVNYTNKSQIARVLTEDWVKNNSYCPNCGAQNLEEFENNKPVADFYCKSCTEQFELKSKNSSRISNKILDGAYHTMIERINSDENPSFFFLTYNKSNWEVNNFLIIPKHYFTPQIIIKRKPLSNSARRAGWVGCNIDITKVPENGRIFLVKNSEVISKNKVQAKWKGTDFLKSTKGERKGWILDIMNCVDAIQKETFTLKEIYAFEDRLKQKYPNNNFIKDKIRQQLQFLRDKGLIEFKSRGTYKKITL